jgi:uncharacterized repeat protein (TIGR01451 family)
MRSQTPSQQSVPSQSVFHRVTRWIGATAVLAMIALPSWSAAEPVSLKFFERQVDYTFGALSGIHQSPAPVEVTGVNGPVSRALLFWHGIDNGGADEVYDNAAIKVNGNAVTGSSLGDATTNCWGAGSSRAFVADVTPFITGNGVYTVSDLATQTDHSCNGVSIVVMFNDGDPNNNRDLAFFAGNDSNIPDGFPGEDDGWNAVLPAIPYVSGMVYAQLHVADGQSFGDGTLSFITSAGTVSIPDSDTLYDGNSVPNNGTGRTTDGMWDVHTFDLSTIFTDPGNYELTVSGNTNTSDCLGLVLMLIDIQGGSAPAVPEIAKYGPARAMPGAPITYTLEYKNPTPVALEGVTITDMVPAGTEFVSATNGGALDSGTVTWSVGSVPAMSNSSVQLMVNVLPTTSGSIVNDQYAMNIPQLPAVTGPPVSTLVPNGVTFEFFNCDLENWTYRTAAPLRSEPTGTVACDQNSTKVTPKDSLTPAGALRIQATDNTNNFGYWESPELVRVGEQVPRTTSLQGIPVVVNPQDPLMLARWRFYSDQENSMVPQIRARITDTDYQQTDMLIINSQGEGNFSPSLNGRDYAMMVWPNDAWDVFRMEFDLLNFGEQDAANGIVEMDFVNIVGFMEAPSLESVVMHGFDEGTDGWEQRVVSPYGEPSFSHTTVNGDGALAINANGNGECFGYWDSVNPIVTLDPTQAYYVRFKVATSADENSRGVAPSFRCRLNDETLQGGAYTRITSTGDASRVPTMEVPMDYYVLFQPDLSMDQRGLLLSFDIMNFLPGDDANMDVYLLEVEVYQSGQRY